MTAQEYDDHLTTRHRQSMSKGEQRASGAPAAAKEMEVDVRGGNRRASAKKEPAPEEPPAEDRTTKGKKGKKEKKEKKEKEPKPEKEKKSGGFFSKKKK